MAMNMQFLMKQAQKIQNDITKAQKQLEEKEYEGTAGGGAIVVKAKGNYHVEAVTKDRFVFKEIKNSVINTYEETMRNENSVAIHVRAGDYLSPQYINQYGNICTLDYYRNSIDYMKSNIETP
ncbi:MAG: YbaB/EbfC family nucleoid-associated protein, partial [Erysipelotrichales bacterium]|nr:YbaB/EbfC family nucleoid-associated protein [Erysipelotrichales bacterium]